MALLYAGPVEQIPLWKDALGRNDPNLDLRFWPDYGVPGDIKMLLVARDIPCDLSLFPNLRAIQTLWAGVDKLLMDSRLSATLPLARMTDTSLARGMAEFVLYHSLDYLRDGPSLRQAQAQSKWQVPPLKLAKDVHIGIMGLGEMGRQALDYLRVVGFSLHGWSQSIKEIDQVQCFAGSDELPAFLKECHIVVCLLPLTKKTTGILNEDFFGKMREGAWLIHAGRGGHLVESDLLSALTYHRPARAVLDVFAEEPLPSHHPFWKHPSITISPHCAAVTPPGAGASLIVENYHRVLKNENLKNLVDRTRQY